MVTAIVSALVATPDARLYVKSFSIGRRPGGLPEDEERDAVIREEDLLLIGERVHRRIFAMTFTAPSADQRS
jgi:hypothetical protein